MLDELSNKKAQYLIRTLFFLFILYSLFIGSIPAGVFCDEAEIGYRSYQFIHGNLSFFITPFFYNHLGYIYGSLPVITTVPSVAIFGLNDFSVRLVSVVFAFLSFGTILLIFQLLKLRFAIISLLSLALTPVFFLIAHTNFGHLPSLFFLLISFALFILAKKKNEIKLAMLSGLALAISSYGQVSFFIFSPLFLIILGLSEIWENRFDLKKITLFFASLLVFIITYFPIIYMGMTHPTFWQRLHDKDSSYIHFSLPQKLLTMAENYSKYYSYTILVQGNDPTPTTIVRHTIPGNGFLLSITFLLMLLGVLYVLFDRTAKKGVFLPFFFLLIVYPLPDLITTKSGEDPYSYSLLGSTLAIPFIVSYALDALHNDKRLPFQKKLLQPLFGIILVLQGLLMYYNYLQLPFTAAHSLGWQYGSKEIVDYFVAHNNDYQELYMSPRFNAPETLLRFYDPEKKCTHCHVGGTKLLNSSRKQLFAISIDELHPEEQRRIIVKQIIYYPNNRKAFILGTFKKATPPSTN